MDRSEGYWLEERRTECNHTYEFKRYCGADVCTKCGDHKGLAKCFCGWTSHGGGLSDEDVAEFDAGY